MMAKSFPTRLLRIVPLAFPFLFIYNFYFFLIRLPSLLPSTLKLSPVTQRQTKTVRWLEKRTNGQGKKKEPFRTGYSNQIGGKIFLASQLLDFSKESKASHLIGETRRDEFLMDGSCRCCLLIPLVCKVWRPVYFSLQTVRSAGRA